MTAQQARERAQAGAAWLDKVEPGWHKRIDVGGLDLSSCSQCILGQTFGDYNHAVRFIPKNKNVKPVEGKLSAAMGFNLTSEDHSNWKTLNKAWIGLLKERVSESSDDASIIASDAGSQAKEAMMLA